MTEILPRKTRFDCQRCGVCCADLPDYEAYADLTWEDVERLSPHYRRNHVVDVGFIDYRPSLATKERPSGMVVCVAFRGQIGKKCRCAIYDRRPGICRWFKPGGRECIAQRRMKLTEA